MIQLSKVTPQRFKGDMIVYFVSKPKKGAPTCADDAVQQVINRACAAGDFKGKEEQMLLFYPPPEASRKQLVSRVLVVGLGPTDKLNNESFRKAGGTVSTAALKTKARKLLVVVPEITGAKQTDMVQPLSEGLILGAYQFRKYKKNEETEDQPGSIEEIAIYAADAAASRKAIQTATVTAGAACTARDIGNEPGSHWTPAAFADHGRELAKRFGLKAKVFSKPELKRLGMGGILAVNQGSAQEPKMVILEYRAGRKVPTLLLVGKGLTFDSGGISLKPSEGMEEMKYDKCGGAAVVAVIQAIGSLKPKNLNVVGIVPATENLPGPAALKPGDIITQYGGKTVEVINTDAEGRLILADALAYGIEKYKPALVVDLATLTGAVIIGLGHHRTGLLSNNDDLADKLLQAGESCGESLWRLPLAPEYTKQLKSEIADIKNVGKRDAGTITAASFLQEFIGDTPWAHLDIAGTAWNFTEKPYIPKGPSGVGVRTIIELIANWK